MTKKDHTVYILLLFLVLGFICYKKRTIKEYFSNDNPIILAGDSIFENSSYVRPGESVEECLKIKNKNIVVVAEDGATINKLVPQLKNIPKHLNKLSSRLFISIGGNDILLHFKGKTFINVDEVKSMIEQYKSTILYVKENYNITIYLTSIYYPTAKPCKRLYEVIRYWNEEQKKFAKKHNLYVFQIDKLLTKDKHFTNEIEPSGLGSKIIADNIENL